MYKYPRAAPVAAEAQELAELPITSSTMLQGWRQVCLNSGNSSVQLWNVKSVSPSFLPLVAVSPEIHYRGWEICTPEELQANTLFSAL